ncbi:unnamed protein product [Lampetra fluviatilis]
MTAQRLSSRLGRGAHSVPSPHLTGFNVMALDRRSLRPDPPPPTPTGARNATICHARFSAGPSGSLDDTPRGPRRHAGPVGTRRDAAGAIPPARGD